MPAWERECEEEVLSHMSQGQSNKEIAAHQGLSPQSVKVYVSNLLRKSGAPNRSGPAHYAVVRTLARTQAYPKVA
jgi:DNA-binding NarL/FixJ family response regulator